VSQLSQAATAQPVPAPACTAPKLKHEKLKAAKKIITKADRKLRNVEKLKGTNGENDQGRGAEAKAGHGAGARVEGECQGGSGPRQGSRDSGAG
jgi:hypothetical protein